MGVDLRNLDELANKLKQSEVDFSVPTIFLAECVLVYIEPQNSANLLTWISSNFTSATFVNYEQVNMNDRFGEVMLQNLRARGCSLAGVDACLSTDTQIARLTTFLFFLCYFLKVVIFGFKYSSILSYKFDLTFRFLAAGWQGGRAWDMVQVYNSIPIAERTRIERLEMLDEGELLIQLFQHYCISVAWNHPLFQDIEINVEKQLSSMSLNID